MGLFFIREAVSITVVKVCGKCINNGPVFSYLFSVFSLHSHKRIFNIEPGTEQQPTENGRLFLFI
jgi:hypothetical protein